MEFIEELKRRNVFRVGVAYLALAWVVIQITDMAVPALNLPPSLQGIVFYIGIVGFPFALFFAWAFELTPDGLKRDHEVDRTQSMTHITGRKLDFAIIAMLVLAVAFLVTDNYLFNETGRLGIAPSDTASSPPIGEKIYDSIGVLPFINISNDPEQEYFSDGIAEELLNALAKLKNLQVAARTSSFAFKGQNQDITGIGNALKVDTVLEGSVRKSGTRLRITAQLIDVANGYHLWSETYDRELTDIFDIQDEISAAIVKELRVHLAGGEVTTTGQAVDIEAYKLYLKGRQSLRLRTRESLMLAAGQYQQAIDIEPGYAAAWVGKALAIDLSSDRNYGNIPKLEALQQAQIMLNMAFSLDPNLGFAHAVQALLLQENDLPEESLISLDLAIKANPSEGILYAWKSNALDILGRHDLSLEAIKTAYKIDPLHMTIRQNLASAYVGIEEDEAARALMTPETTESYDLEAQIAERSGRFADMFLAYERSAELGGDVSNIVSMTVRSGGYFFWLKNVELAQEVAPKRLIPTYQSILNPEEAYQRLRYLPSVGDRNSTLGPWVYTMIQTERYEEALAALKPRGFGERPLHGNLQYWNTDVWLAYMQAFCLQQLGSEEASGALAGKIQQFIDYSARRGTPARNYSNLLAGVQLLQGEEDAAMSTLKKSLSNHALSWVHFRSPYYGALHGRADFQALSASAEKHLNGERAKLGWNPVEF